jgi:predicted helicase
MLMPNLALIGTRQITRLPFCHVFVSRWPIEEKTGSHDRTTQLFPLYLYDDVGHLRFVHQDIPRHPGLSEAFISTFSTALRVQIGNHGTVTIEQVFDYIYSILHSPSYREQFGPDLMADFARIPLTRNLEMFRSLAVLGGELIALHLLESPKLDNAATILTLADADVERVSYARNTVWLDKAQTRGFKDIPEAVWNFHIGGYQICEKWLKDRKGRTLSKGDISHYQKIVAAISETIRITAEIDKVIEAHGGWPGAFVAGARVSSKEAGS